MAQARAKAQAAAPQSAPAAAPDYRVTGTGLLTLMSTIDAAKRQRRISREEAWACVRDFQSRPDCHTVRVYADGKGVWYAVKDGQGRWHGQKVP